MLSNLARKLLTGVLPLLVAAVAMTGAAGAPGAAAAPVTTGPNGDDVVATFSIVGRDAATGELGVAVQSKFFAVGSVVPWAKAGVGAIATQAFANTTYGPEGLSLLRNAHSAQEALDALIVDDAARNRRQVGIVDAQGRAAAFTGDECMAWAGHEVGEGFTVQGNILVGAETVAAMAKAFRDTKGMLGERLMTALEAGQAAGGDSRGMQSAAILIVKEGGGYAGLNDRYCDLRVDDHRDPIGELRRVFSLWKVDAMIRQGYQLVDEERYEEALRLARETARLAPKDGEVYYHWACFLSRGGEGAAAMKRLSVAIDLEPSLAQQARTDPDLEPLRDDPMFERIVGK